MDLDQIMFADVTILTISSFLISSPEHEVLMMSYCGQSVTVGRRAASTIALKAYSSYTPGSIDSILGRKHRCDL